MSAAGRYVELVIGSMGKSGKRISLNYSGTALVAATSWQQRLLDARFQGPRDKDGILTNLRYYAVVDRTRAIHVIDLTKVVHVTVYGGRPGSDTGDAPSLSDE